MRTLLEILDAHKATMSVPLPDGVGSQYSEYHAIINFANGKIEVNIYDDEGGAYGHDYDEPFDIKWIDTISKFVADLKEAKTVPVYTLDLLSTSQE